MSRFIEEPQNTGELATNIRMLAEQARQVQAKHLRDQANAIEDKSMREATAYGKQAEAAGTLAERLRGDAHQAMRGVPS